MAYGDKRDYRKIDIEHKALDGFWHYCATTTWAETCEQAKISFCLARPNLDASNVRARFAPLPLR